MKLILTNEVTGLGTPGDIVEVKDGYARNYLMPRGLATPWTKGGQKQVEAIQKARVAREHKSIEEAKDAKARLEVKAYKVPVKSGQGGRLYGSVNSGQIVDAIVSAGGPQVDRRTLEVQGSIRSLGAHTATVRLHPEISATVKLDVVAAK
ncbi:50S ribosomal protein L9 [Arsenicicoccus sp. oral taxon 190]|uniref:50S ribosomal protein L9 n=1 Tax=Arsenicicoccus sp. oral taxon 190 TaxID=1658671 RepID=UPI00067A0D29|nr:50S ribosomal protein L9 [Arsenicicoccus sp. oral taxon 190]AKT50884.1 50S ribosomal protein L9 [Arsenicicoccus sp. oral taxon 190]